MIRLQRRALAALMVLAMLAAQPLALCDAAQPSRALQPGDRGDVVEELQQRLCELGYLHDRIDGRYGTRTRQAVNRFQKSEGIEISGIADEHTLSLLFDPDVHPVSVFVAPTGKRYHARENCRGLRQAKSVSGLSFPEAEAERTPCILCYGRLALRIAEEKHRAREAGSPESPASDAE